MKIVRHISHSTASQGRDRSKPQRAIHVTALDGRLEGELTRNEGAEVGVL